MRKEHWSHLDEVQDDEIGWFDPEQKPVHSGMYIIHPACGDGTKWRYWNGSNWMVGSHSFLRAAENTDISQFQRLRWKGLK